MRFLDLVPGRKPGAWSAPRFTSKPARRIESAQRFSRSVRSCGAAAGERKNPRPGAQLRGPRCTGRAWWPVDLVTWAAPAGPVAVVPGAQLFAPMYVHTFAVIRSHVCTYVRSYSRALVPGRWPLPGGRSQVAAPRWPLPGGRSQVAAPRWPLPGGRSQVAGAGFVITCAQVNDPRPGGRGPWAVARALVAG